MMAILSWFGKRGTECLAAGVFLGLAIPDMAAAARPLLVPAIAAMLTLSLLRLDPAGVVGALRRPQLVVPAVGFVLLASPLLGFTAASMLDLAPGIAVALVVWSASPPLISVPAIATLVGLDGALALTVTTAAGLLVPVTLPPLVFALLGLELDIGPTALMIRLALLLAGTGAAAAAIRRLAGPARLQRHAPAIDGGFVLVMLLFAVAVLDGVTAAALTEPVRVAGLLALVFGASLGMQALGWLVFNLAGARAATTLALACGNRNMALVLGSAPAAFDPDSFLFLALLQFPIYLLPVLLRPIYRRASGQGWSPPANRG
ncbi:MAG: hypothetical protein RLO51_23405 [Thalassobaculum sp.]|uniref:hypothetical protein n=1 Tax=Thalassobaculum sp. TaxID=2022740 RepID=UPI0032EB650D